MEQKIPEKDVNQLYVPLTGQRIYTVVFNQYLLLPCQFLNKHVHHSLLGSLQLNYNANLTKATICK